jgi:aminomethyltransferase
MGISWQGDRIVSVATPGLPETLVVKGLSCGFVKVDRPLPKGEALVLQEKKRSLPVTVVADIRPDRTARLRLSTFV